MSAAGKIGDLDAGRYIDNLGGVARISLSLGIICNTGIDIDPHNAEEAGIAELVVVILSDVPLSPCVAGEGAVVAGDIVPGIKGDLLIGAVADKLLGYTSLERSTVLSGIPGPSLPPQDRIFPSPPQGWGWRWYKKRRRWAC